MKYRPNSAAFSKIFLLIFSLLAVLPAYGADPSATLFSIEGTVEVQRQGSTDWASLVKDDSLFVGDTVKTGSASRAAILFADGVITRLNQNTRLEIQAPSAAEQELKLESGEGYFFSRKPRRFPKINTPNVSAAVRGTEFVVTVNNNGSAVAVLDGAVLAENSFGRVDLIGGERADVKPGAAPIKSILINPAESVQWTLYYPAVLSGADSALSPIEAALASGNVPKAENLIAEAQKSRGDSSALESFRALILLIKGDRANAQLALQKAQGTAGADPVTLLVSSYVKQAFFDIEGAASEIDALLKLNPDSALVLARRAELELAQGNWRSAIELAERAVKLDPASVQALTTLGFAYLTRYEPELALDSFNKALASDDTFGLAYLGRGLAIIRKGDLERGRKELEKAAALEPITAVYRSYLGKAYFEEEREDLAAHEYDRAIALDDKDPTPYLYRAYNRLSQNQVVGALSDVEDSIARNDNRAVYRSSLLLDKDSAVRSAGLAEVFNSLGFSRVASVEAIKALNRDYGNYSAHRLLADSYNTIETADAGVSERAITELLSPLSFNLFTSPGTGAALNEYNALFERPDHKSNIFFSGSTLQDAMVPEVFQSGRGERYGYLLGVQGGYTNGSHDSDSGRDYRARAALQYQFSPDDRAILSGSYQDISIEDDSLPLYDQKFERHDVKLGYQHQFSPGSQIITEVSHRDTRDRLEGLSERNSLVDVILGGELYPFEDPLGLDELAAEDIRDLRASVQYILDSDLVSVVFGGEHYYASPRREEESLILDDELDIFLDTETYLRSLGTPYLNSDSVYLYPTFHLSDWLDLTLGGKYSNVDVENREVMPFSDNTVTRVVWSPKLGATAYLTSDLTLRAAYFEGVRKSALEDFGSLEPTIVGGMNQVLSDYSGTRSRNYGGGVDYKIAKSTYVGAEYLNRHLIESDFDFINRFEFDLDAGTESSEVLFDDETDIHITQDKVKAYIYQVISDRLVATLDYAIDNYDNQDPDIEQSVDLQRASGAVRYFDPSGLFAVAVGTWREQERDGSFFVEDGTTDFWIFDMAVGYRFPHRSGSVAFKVNNIFDENFDYDQSLGIEEGLADERFYSVVFSTNF